MDKKEYLTVAEISKYHKTSTRNVTRIIKILKESTNDYLIHKDKGDIWKVHHLLINKFKPKRERKSQYFALTIRPHFEMPSQLIVAAMQLIFEQLDELDCEINYTIESGTMNSNLNHVHCYVKSQKKRKLRQLIKESFYRDAPQKNLIKVSVIYDLDKWKRYMTKSGGAIVKLKK